MADEVKIPTFSAVTKRGLTRVAGLVRKLSDPAMTADLMPSTMRDFHAGTTPQKKEIAQALAWIEAKCLVRK